MWKGSDDRARVRRGSAASSASLTPSSMFTLAQSVFALPMAVTNATMALPKPHFTAPVMAVVPKVSASNGLVRLPARPLQSSPVPLP